MPISKGIPTIIMLLILTTSCEPIGDTMPAARSISGDEISSPIATPVQAPDLFTPTASPPDIRFQCLQILPSEPGNLGISGQIILRDYQRNGPLFALDLANGQRTEILGSSGPHTIAAVSPGRQLLAYRDNDSTGDGDNLVIVDTKRVVQKSIPWQADWLTIVNWINDRQLALQNLDPEARMVILDWISSQERPISFSQLPDFSDSVIEPWAEYDPTLERVLYPVTGDEYSLFDLTAGRSIARLPSWSTEAPDAAWTQDGEVVAVIGPSPEYYDNLGGSDEIFAINRNGQVEQITRLADYYGRNLGLYSPSWSPNGTQLAFWLYHSINEGPKYVLTIVDSRTKAATNLCISSDPSGYGGEFRETLPPPIWSPDGEQILVENRFSEDHNRIILVDLSHTIAMVIAQDARPVGWMVAQP